MVCRPKKASATRASKVLRDHAVLPENACSASTEEAYKMFGKQERATYMGHIRNQAPDLSSSHVSRATSHSRTCVQSLLPLFEQNHQLD